VTAVEDQHKGIALGADAYRVKPFEREWLLEQLTKLTEQGAVEKILVIDDDEIARYLLKQSLVGMPYVVTEAANGREGLRRAREDHPRVIFLDLTMPDMTGVEVLEHLQTDPVTNAIPIIVFTSKTLGGEEREWLARRVATILPKASSSREVVIAAVRDVLSTSTREQRIV